MQAIESQLALDPGAALSLNPIPSVSQPDPEPAQADTGGSGAAIPFSQPSSGPRSGEPRSVVQNAEPSIVTPSQHSQSSQANSRHAAYLGTSGYMSIFSQVAAEEEDPSLEAQPAQSSDVIAPVLQESYLDTYFEFAYTWCPVLDRQTLSCCPEFSESLLLRHALALLGSHLNPPLMTHHTPLDHYQRFRQLFYDNHERHPLVRICAVMLVYWWSSGPPNVVSIDTNWWWMGASIRLSQEVGLHHEQDSQNLWQPEERPGLRRRIWWTLFVSLATSRILAETKSTSGTRPLDVYHAGAAVCNRSRLLRH